MLCSGGFGNMLVQMCEEVKGNSFKCPTLGFRMRTLLSIQLVCEADVLAFGAEAQTTSLAPQRNNILMDLVVVTRIIWMSFNHYRSDPVQVQSTRMHACLQLKPNMVC